MKSEKTHLETLRIPILDFTYRGHFTQVVRKFIKLLDTVGKTDRELLCATSSGKVGKADANQTCVN